jgi:hypothetical protein
MEWRLTLGPNNAQDRQDVAGLPEMVAAVSIELDH